MRRKILTALVIMGTLMMLVGCSMFGEVEPVVPITDINSSYVNQLNPSPIAGDNTIVMADETVALEFDGPTWTELRVKYGLSVPLVGTTTIEVPIPTEPVEQLDKSGLLETMAIEKPMDADDGNKYILLKGQWYLYNKTDGVHAYINNKCGALNFRVGPSTGNKILTSYKRNTKVQVYMAAHMSDNSTWYYVKQENGDMGWQHSYYINIEETEKVKPATADILGLTKPTYSTETITVINHDTSGHLWTKKYTEVDEQYKEVGYTFVAPTRLWCYTGAGYTNDRIMSVEAGTPLQVLGKAEMSNGLTWYRVKWSIEVEVVDTEETEQYERVDESTTQTNTDTEKSKTQTVVNTPDVTDVTTLPSWQKLLNQEDTSEDRVVIANELLEEMRELWPNAIHNPQLKDAGNKKIFVMLEAETEDVADAAELRASWYNKLVAVLEEKDIKAYNVYSIVKYNTDLERNETKVCLVYELVTAAPTNSTSSTVTTPGLIGETTKQTEDAEPEMITVIKEYIGYIDYNVEKKLTNEQIAEMYGHTVTVAPTSVPTVKATPTPVITSAAKPTVTPKPKVTATPKPKVTVTPTPTLDKGMVAAPYNSSDVEKFTSTTATTVVAKLKKAGFVNIETVATYYDPNVGQPEGLVYQIKIANSTRFTEGQAFYKDAKVIVYYYTRIVNATPTPTNIPATQLDPNICKSPYNSSVFGSSTSSATYYVSTVEAAFRKAGFTNVNTYAEPYNPQIGQPEGMVYTVEVGGSTRYTTDTTYYKDTVVNIRYYTREGISGTGNQGSDNVDKVSSPLASTVFTDNSNSGQYLLDTTLNLYKNAGFTNVRTAAIYYDTTIGQPEGMVKYVTIAGSKSFTLSNKYYKDAEVIIYYYTRKQLTPYSNEDVIGVNIGSVVAELQQHGFTLSDIYLWGMQLSENEWVLDEYYRSPVSNMEFAYKVRKNNAETWQYVTEYESGTVWPNSTVVYLYPDYDD